MDRAGTLRCPGGEGEDVLGALLLGSFEEVLWECFYGVLGVLLLGSVEEVFWRVFLLFLGGLPVRGC